MFSFIDESSELIQIGISQIVYGFKALLEDDISGT